MIHGQTCSTCRFFVAMPDRQCRAHAPTAQAIVGQQGPQVISFFPPVMPDQWCGDWVADLAMMPVKSAHQ